MDSVLKTIQALNGVYDVCIYHDAGILGSTFTDEKNHPINAAIPIVEQIFSALETIAQQHDELYIHVGDKLLVVYRFIDCCSFLLLTDKKVNFPLINMGVKSAVGKLRSLKLATNHAATKSSAVSSTPQPLSIPSATILPILEQWRNLLFDYFGPVAPLIFNDALYVWQRSTKADYDHLPQLLQLITAEFDSAREKSAFQKQAKAAMSNH